MYAGVIPAWIIGRRSVYVEGIIASVSRSNFHVQKIGSTLESLKADHYGTDEAVLCLIVMESPVDGLQDAFSKAEQVRNVRPHAFIACVSSGIDKDLPPPAFSEEIDAFIYGDITGTELTSLLSFMTAEDSVVSITIRSRKRLLSVLKDDHLLKSHDGEESLLLKQNGMNNRLCETSDIGFSKREREVLRGLADGDSNKVLARKLLISEATVKAHVRTVFRKLGAHNRTQAVRSFMLRYPNDMRGSWISVSRETQDSSAEA